jgi:3-hydroxyisobutyrate dehydrogenase-like beta-hydroxyacid dehydrogenase
MPAGRPDIYKDARPFKKGQSGNPKGRPKLPDLSEAIARVLSEEKDGLTALDAILAALRAKAAKGDVRAAQELLDRGFGKSKQFIDHTTAGEPLIFKFTDNAGS